MLLLPFARDRVLVSEDKVDLVRSPTLVRTKHDGERSLPLSALPACPDILSERTMGGMGGGTDFISVFLSVSQTIAVRVLCQELDISSSAV